jgi:hypothetical protein
VLLGLKLGIVCANTHFDVDDAPPLNERAVLALFIIKSPDDLNSESF